MSKQTAKAIKDLISEGESRFVARALTDVLKKKFKKPTLNVKSLIRKALKADQVPLLTERQIKEMEKLWFEKGKLNAERDFRRALKKNSSSSK
jgi:hypothetical protein